MQTLHGPNRSGADFRKQSGCFDTLLCYRIGGANAKSAGRLWQIAGIVDALQAWEAAIGSHVFSTLVIIGVIFFLFSGVAPVMALWLAVALVIFVAAKRGIKRLYPGHDWLNHKPSPRENMLKPAMAVIAYAAAWYLYTRTDSFFEGLLHRALNPG